MSEQELELNEMLVQSDHDESGVRPYCMNKVVSGPVDPETVKKAQKGDDEAFSKLFWQTYRYVYGIAKRYLRRDEDIYDAIQETYTTVYASLEKLKTPEAFVNWVGKIAVTCSRSMAEKMAATGTDPLDDDDELVEIDDTATDPTIEVSLDVTAVLSQMDPADAELLTYVYYDRLRVTEIAKMQGIPVTTVYSRLNAAKRKLKELLKIRGIEKAVYGGDLIAIITTALRNAIGTNLLSMAVAAEILHSVTGKDTKSAAVIAAVARKQRNAAVLKIASWLLASVMLVIGVVTVAYYFIKSPKNDGDPSSGDLTVGTSTDVQDTNGSNVGNVYSSWDLGALFGSGVLGSQGNATDNSSTGSEPSTPSSGNIGENVDGTSSSGNSSTETSGEIGGTGVPDSGTDTGSTDTESTVTSSQKPSSTVSTISSSSASSSAASSSEASTPSDEEVWKVKEVSGGVEIKGISIENSSGVYEIPSEIGGKTVVGIGDMAFHYESGMKSITIPETVQYIGEQAFANANGLTSIVIPSSVTEIKSNAFMSCLYLSDIYIRSTNINIATYAFSNSYQRNVTLTIHAPASTMTAMRAQLNWDADYEEWYG